MPGGAGKEKGGEEEHNLLSCGLYAYVAPGGTCSLIVAADATRYQVVL